MKKHEMITLNEKQVKDINQSLHWGNKKIIAIELGLKYSAFSRYLRAIPLYNTKTKKFDVSYRMPLHVYNAIIQFINNK